MTAATRPPCAEDAERCAVRSLHSASTLSISPAKQSVPLSRRTKPQMNAAADAGKSADVSDQPSALSSASAPAVPEGLKQSALAKASAGVVFVELASNKAPAFLKAMALSAGDASGAASARPGVRPARATAASKRLSPPWLEAASKAAFTAGCGRPLCAGGARTATACKKAAWHTEKDENAVSVHGWGACHGQDAIVAKHTGNVSLCLVKKALKAGDSSCSGWQSPRAAIQADATTALWRPSADLGKGFNRVLRFLGLQRRNASRPPRHGTHLTALDRSLRGRVSRPLLEPRAAD